MHGNADATRILFGKKLVIMNYFKPTVRQYIIFLISAWSRYTLSMIDVEFSFCKKIRLNRLEVYN